MPNRPEGKREGWTTGTCASAAAKAAAIGVVSGRIPEEVEVAIPNGRRFCFPVMVAPGHKPEVAPGESAAAVVVKDAGDDPDCTDGAHMTAEVWPLVQGSETILRAGSGVGTVTMLGLGLEVGGPAINPVPRRMILAALSEVGGSFEVEFSVPGGEVMAEETTNARLGIVGGISILGTTGIVRPFSTAAFRASLTRQVDVAAANGQRHLVFATGSRSEAAAMAMFGSLAPVCFVEVGDYSGVALRRAAGQGIERVTMVAMAGKITKLAAGTMMTHFHRSDIDNALLAEVAIESGSSDAVLNAATATATARHFFEICMETNELGPLGLLCRRAAAACAAHCGNKLSVDVVMVDFDGRGLVARS